MKRIIQRIAALVIGLGLGFGALAGLETVTHISDLNSSWPLGSDLASTSDDHIRNIKVALKTDFPNINAAVTATPAQLNQLTSSTFTGAMTFNSTVAASGVTSTVAGAAFTAKGGAAGASNISYMQFIDSGATRKGYVGDTQSADSSIYLESDAGGVILAPAVQPASVLGSATGASNVSYLSFLDSAGARKAYIGDASASTSDIVIESDAGNVSFIPLSSTGVIQGSTDGGATFVDMTPATGTFTITTTGISGTPSGTATWTRVGKLVTVALPTTLSGTSTATTFTLTGVPAAIQPATLDQQTPALGGKDNGTTMPGACIQITHASGTWTVQPTAVTTGWTASGVKQIGSVNVDIVFSYLLN